MFLSYTLAMITTLIVILVAVATDKTYGKKRDMHNGIDLYKSLFIKTYHSN